MRIEALDIDEEILEKIASKHGIQLYEAEEACFSIERHVRREREGLYKVFGRTEAGRYVLVVLADRGSGRFMIVTAREMRQNERRLYRRK